MFMIILKDLKGYWLFIAQDPKSNEELAQPTVQITVLGPQDGPG